MASEATPPTAKPGEWRGALEFARGYIAALWNDVDEIVRSPDAPPGSGAVAVHMSDALDDLDKALEACPKEVGDGP